MKVATVIPSFNHKKYIEEAIESVLAQTHKIHQLIIIDDGSSDNSVELITKKYGKNPKVKLIEQQNQNAFNALNRGMRLAYENQADVISILNSDDFYHQERIARCLPLLEKKNINVIATNYKIIDSENNIISANEENCQKKVAWFQKAWQIYRTKKISLTESLARCNFIATTSNLIGKAEYFITNPFRDYHFAHDYFFLLTAAMRDCLEILDEDLLSYRVHAENTMNASRENLLSEMLLLMTEFMRYISPELTSFDKRQRFYDFLYGFQQNISCFNFPAQQLFLANLLKLIPEKKIRETFTNFTKNMTGETDYAPRTGALLVGNENNDANYLLEKYEQNLVKNAKLRQEITENTNLSRLEKKLLASKWFALGRLLNFNRSLLQKINSDKAKYNKILRDLQRSNWVKIGSKLGSKTAKNILKEDGFCSQQYR